LIGSIVLNVSGQWIPYTQNGDEILWADARADFATSTLGTTAQLVGLSVPPGRKVNALVRGFAFGAGTTTTLISSPDESVTSPNAVPGNNTAQNPINGGAQGTIFTLNVRTNTSGQIRAVSTAASTTMQIATHGWIEKALRTG
jgi:hypothetical protein